MLNIQVEGKRRRGGYHQEDVKHNREREEGKDTTKKMLNMWREREEGEDTTKKMLNMCREREEGEDTTKKMLNIQVEGKRRRG